MNNDIQQRFKDAGWFDPTLEIIICGLGNIGSNVSYILCKQNYNTYLYDFDTVSIENIGPQMFSMKDIGKNKAIVAKELAASYGNTNYTTFGRFEENSPIGNIVFSCFDNMSSRKLLFEKWLDYQKKKTKEYREANPKEVNIFIDGRLTLEDMQIYFVKSLKEADLYRKTLFDDSEVEEAVCTYKATCHTGTMIASLMVIGFLNHVANRKIDRVIREVPFAVEYSNAGMMQHKYKHHDFRI